MNKEKTLDIIASIVVFIGKFIVTPILALIVILALMTVCMDAHNSHIPLIAWLQAFLIVTPIFGGILLLAWATVRRENKRWNGNF